MLNTLFPSTMGEHRYVYIKHGQECVTPIEEISLEFGSLPPGPYFPGLPNQ